MTPEPQTPTSEFGAAVAQVTELTQRIVQQEIELAKAEVSEKVTKLAKGAAVGAAAGVFVIFGAIYFFEGAAWLIWQQTGTTNSFWLGFLIVALFLFLLAGIAGFLAYKFIKGGSPPVPQMAIDEGKKVRATLTDGGKP